MCSSSKVLIKTQCFAKFATRLFLVKVETANWRQKLSEASTPEKKQAASAADGSRG